MFLRKSKIPANNPLPGTLSPLTFLSLSFLSTFSNNFSCLALLLSSFSCFSSASASFFAETIPLRTLSISITLSLICSKRVAPGFLPVSDIGAGDGRTGANVPAGAWTRELDGLTTNAPSSSGPSPGPRFFLIASGLTFFLFPWIKSLAPDAPPLAVLRASAPAPLAPTLPTAMAPLPSITPPFTIPAANPANGAGMLRYLYS